LDLVRSVAVVSLLALAVAGVSRGGGIEVVGGEGVQVEGVAAGSAVIVVEVIGFGGSSGVWRRREKRKGMVAGRLQVGVGLLGEISTYVKLIN
jgi:hypothetical protein